MKHIFCLTLLALSLHAADNNENNEKRERKEIISITSLLKKQAENNSSQMSKNDQFYTFEKSSIQPYYGFLDLKTGLGINDLSGLHDIPNVDRAIWIDARSNKITKIPYKMFRTLHQLETIILAFNNIKEFGDEAFPRNIVDINLSHNKLSRFNPKAVLDCNALTCLNLSNNALSGTFNLSLFSALKKLTHLWLDHNEINELTVEKIKDEKELKYKLPKQLKSLSLQYNKLTGLPDKTIYAFFLTYRLSEKQLQDTSISAFKLNLYMNDINDKERERLRGTFNGNIELHFSDFMMGSFEAEYYKLWRENNKRRLCSQ